MASYFSVINITDQPIAVSITTSMEIIVQVEMLNLLIFWSGTSIIITIYNMLTAM